MKRPWMPLYIADYLADTAHLNTSEHGAYLLLMMHYWSTGGLPKDEAVIARITRMSARQWAQSRDLLKSLFDDKWRHKRIDKELAHAIEISNARSASALKMHSKRAPEAKQKNTHSPSPSQLPKKVVALRAPAPSKAVKPKTEKVVPIRKKMPVPLPQDWKPSTVNNDYARGAGLTEFEFAKEVKKFRNYHHAKGTIFADWDAAWRNWCDKALEYLGRVAKDLPAQTPRADALDVVRNWPREKWIQILRVYASTNNWPAAYGPPPGERGCLVPTDLLQGPEEPTMI